MSRMGRGVVINALKIVALAGPILWGAVSLSQVPATKIVPDAQVEANVLKALAGASDLASQPITTTTVYGVVTLSGSVQTEALRAEAETIASRAGGVQKVVDEMTLSSDAAKASVEMGASQSSGGMQPDSTRTQPQVAQSQVPPQAQGSPESDNTEAPNQASAPEHGPGVPEHRQAYGGQAPTSGPQPQGAAQQPWYPQPQSRSNGFPQQGYGGQAEGQMVTISSGSLLRMRINQSLDSGRTQPGTTFDGVVVSDVVADGAVAIPRGASVQGTVLDVQRSGALKGRGALSLQLTHITLAGRTYPLVSDVWMHNGGDKTTETVDRTVIGGGIGALIGAAAGGGAGAAIGAGVGGALGLGSSAASGNGQVYVPAEGLLTFHLAQPVTVATVSQLEMDRLAQGVPMGAQQPLRRRYPGVSYGPRYYGAYPPYRAYPPYPPYPPYGYSPYPY